jgi:hypothetical protein
MSQVWVRDIEISPGSNLTVEKKHGLILINTDQNSPVKFGREPDHAASGLPQLVSGLERSDRNEGNAGEADLRAEPADLGAGGFFQGQARWRFWSEAT